MIVLAVLYTVLSYVLVAAMILLLSPIPEKARRRFKVAIALSPISLPFLVAVVFYSLICVTLKAIDDAL